MNRIGYILTLISVFVFAGLNAYAQTRTPVPQQTNRSSDFGIYTMLTKVADSKDDDEIYQRYANKINEKDYSDWLFIDVKFPVITPSSRDSWGMWVDDLEVRLEIIGYSNTKNGRKPVMLQFTQPLNAVMADGKSHHVRFFVPPYAFYRYLATTKNKNELRKRIGQMYILATVMWRGNPVSFITSTGKNAPSKRSIVENMRKMRDRRSDHIDNAILPAEFTPWNGRSVNRFESMKINMQQRSR
ncbi:MAG: hypothetical protein IKB16_02275 [Lentisphaeria bacterium]|nr:hypothetical protein [Lentisphaeria bacterium]